MLPGAPGNAPKLILSEFQKAERWIFFKYHQERPASSGSVPNVLILREFQEEERRLILLWRLRLQVHQRFGGMSLGTASFILRSACSSVRLGRSRSKEDPLHCWSSSFRAGGADQRGVTSQYVTS